MPESKLNLGFELEAGHGGLIAMLMASDKFASMVTDWCKANIADEDVYGKNGKGRDLSPHITVQNGIISESAEDIEKILFASEPIGIKLGGISIFRNPDRPYDVLKIDVVSSSLHSLNSEIRQSLDVNDPFGPYNPHLTLAYLKRGTGDRYVGDDSFVGIEEVFDTMMIAGGSTKPRKASLKRKEPLKESLDYGFTANAALYAAQDLEDYLLTSGRSVKDISKAEIESIVKELSK